MNRALMLCVLLATPAFAQDGGADPAAAATLASQVHASQCADIRAGEALESAEGNVAVSNALLAVARSLEAGAGEEHPYLLYWKGLLHDCLDQQENALRALRGFVDAAEGDADYASQVRRAQRRIRVGEVQVGRAKSGSRAPAGRVAGVVLGGVLLGGGGALGGLSGWQSQELSRLQAQFDAGEVEWSETELTGERAHAAATTTNALIGAAAGTGAAGVATLIITAASSGKAKAAAVVLPTPGGLTLGVGGRW